MSIFDRIKEAIVAPFEDDQSKPAKLPDDEISEMQRRNAEKETARAANLKSPLK